MPLSEHFHITGVPETKEKGTESLFNKIIAKSFPKLERDMDIQIQEDQRLTNRFNTKWSSLSYIIIKLSKVKYKKRILQAPKEKCQVTFKGIPISLSIDFSGQERME
jgi:hypothetical protein